MNEEDETGEQERRTGTMNEDKQIEIILSKYGEYYIHETVRYFYEYKEEPNFTEVNEADIEAKQRIKDLITTARRETINKAIKYIRSGEVAGSFSEGCKCEMCNKYEKDVRQQLTKEGSR